MSFGLRDKDWVDPDEKPDYGGKCNQCRDFTECPCGCGWGYCDSAQGEFFEGDVEGCPDGEYAYGMEPW